MSQLEVILAQSVLLELMQLKEITLVLHVMLHVMDVLDQVLNVRAVQPTINLEQEQLASSVLMELTLLREMLLVPTVMSHVTLAMEPQHTVLLVLSTMSQLEATLAPSVFLVHTLHLEILLVLLVWPTVQDWLVSVRSCFGLAFGKANASLQSV